MKKWVFLLAALLLLLSSILVIGGCGEKKYDLTVSVGPTGGGTTSPAAGTHEYDKDASVTITATPATGYQFVNWTGDASGTTATATVTMTEDKSVKANFAKIQYTLTMAKVGNGTTTPTVGASTHDTGTVVDITATPDTGWHFVNWTGDVADVDDATTTVTMSANKTVTANFAISAYTLTMAKVGNGTIVPDVGAHTENAGAVVNLTATADSGWQFVNWTGDVATVADVNDATTTVTVNGNYTITAHFIQLFTLTMAKDGTGTIVPAVGPHNYPAATVVNLTATPDTGWEFVNWTGDVATVTDVNDATTTVTMSGNYTITANFVALAQYTLTMAVDDATHGSTTPVGSNTVYEGLNPISATALAGWKFDHWSGADVSKVANVNAASTTIDMDADYSITANFVAIPTYVLTMAVDDPSRGTVSGAGTYNEETVVPITATALIGWKFDHWSGNVGTVADVSDPTTTVTMNGDYTITANFVAQAYPGVGSQWVYTVTYGTTPEVTTWTVNVTAMEAVSSVNCYKTSTTFSANPVRTTAGTPSYTVTISASDTWRSVSNLAQYKIYTNTNLGASTMTDTYTGTPNFFTVSQTWSFAEVGAFGTTNYTVAVVGQETVLGHACYKVEYRVSGNLVKTEWWSPEVMGIVKQVDTGTYAQTETRELVSFTWAA